MDSSNQYGSVLRTYTVRNLYEAALTPGTDVVMPYSGGLARFVPQLTMHADKETNFIIQKVGIFSNFADGLVFKTPADRIDLSVNAAGFKLQTAGVGITDVHIGLVFTYGSRAVTTAFGNPGWTIGTTYAVAIDEPTTGQTLLQFITATAANTGNLQDYWQYSDTIVSTLCHQVAQVAVPPTVRYKNISVLNSMYNFNQFFTPLVFTIGIATYAYMGVYISWNYDDSHNTTFMTHTIHPAFTGATVFFDLVLDIEFTEA